jgi:gluconokinase
MFVIVMGVSGSGKTTIGKGLAGKLGYRFYEGDDFHPAANMAKMAAGVPLDDEDRAGWLAALASVIRDALERGESGVIACSALKEKYRAMLRIDAGRVRFVYLEGSYEVIRERMETRQGHFMKPALLRSQFEALEEPQGELTVDIGLSPEEIIQSVAKVVLGSITR